MLSCTVMLYSMSWTVCTNMCNCSLENFRWMSPHLFSPHSLRWQFHWQRGTTQDVSGPQGNTSTGMTPSARHDSVACCWRWNKLSVSVALWSLQWDGQTPLSGSQAPLAPPRRWFKSTEKQTGCKAVFNTSLPSLNPGRFPLDKTLLT